MREYGQIQSSYWTHPEIKYLPEKARLLGAYLLTSKHSNGLGCFQIPKGYIQSDLGWSEKDTINAIDTLSKGSDTVSKGFISYCLATEFVLIHGFLRWNPISNPKVALARVAEFGQIPSKFGYFQELRDEIVKNGNHFCDDFLNRIETLSKPFRNKTLPEPEPEPTQNQPESIVELKPDDSLDVFQFWQSTMNHPRAAFDDKRKALIRKCLKNYSPDDLKKAITGCSVTPHNMGDNDRGEVYDSIELIFRDAAHIDRFMKNADNPPSGKVKTIQQTVDQSSQQADRIIKHMGLNQ